MNRRLELFREAAKCFTSTKQTTFRKLYTDHIYPYPHKYMRTKFPSMVLYRETWSPPDWALKDHSYAWYGWRIFWSYWWYKLFSNPEALLGHFTEPDPHKWTNEELGIPPDDMGSYYDWLKERENN